MYKARWLDYNYFNQAPNDCEIITNNDMRHKASKATSLTALILINSRIT